MAQGDIPDQLLPQVGGIVLPVVEADKLQHLESKPGNNPWRHWRRKL